MAAVPLLGPQDLRVSDVRGDAGLRFLPALLSCLEARDRRGRAEGLEGHAVLKIDYDRPEDVVPVDEIEARLARAGYRPVRLERRISPSERGQHLVITIAPAPRSNYAVVALQAILGSDPYREACNVQRVRGLPQASKFWRARWNVLYRHKRRREPLEVLTWPS